MVIQVLSHRDLEMKSGCKGKVVLEILSHITPSCIALSNKKLRANIQVLFHAKVENIVLKIGCIKSNAIGVLH
jgi:hypothetical protein